MGDVLLVFAREDEAAAASLAESIEQSGLAVSRGPAVLDAVESCVAAIVLWSSSSVRSPFVAQMASRAHRAGKLIGACLDGCPPPAAFGRPPLFDLAGWSGAPDDPALDPLFFQADRMASAARLRGFVGHASPEPSAPVDPIQPPEPTPPPKPPAASTAAPPANRKPDPPAQRPPILGLRTEVRGQLPRGAWDRQPLERMAWDKPAAPRPDVGGLRRAGPAPPAPPPPAVPPQSFPEMAETRVWKQIQNSRDPLDYLTYLETYGPQGLFAELAQQRLDQLSGSHRKTTYKPAPILERKPDRPPEPPRPRARPPEDHIPEPKRSPSYDRDYDRGAERAPEPVEVQPPRRPQPAERPYRPTSSHPAPQRPPDDWLEPPPRPYEYERDQPPHEYARRASSRGNGAMLRILIFVAVGAGAVYGAMQFLNSSAPKSTRSMQMAANYPDTEPLEPGPDDTLIRARPDPNYTAAFKSDGKGGASIARPPATEKSASAARAPTAPATTLSPEEADRLTASFTPPMQEIPAMPTYSSAPAAPPSEEARAPGPLALAPGAEKPAPKPAAAPGFVRWVTKPTGQELEELYPKAAQQRQKGGRVNLSCTVLANLHADCRVVAEEPAGLGFGAAALKAARRLTAAAVLSDGSSAVGAATKLTIAFAPAE